MNIEHYTRVGRLLAELHGDEVLSEQQCAKIMGVDLVSWRIIEHTFCRGSWGETVDESGPTSEEAILAALSASTEAAAGEPVGWPHLHEIHADAACLFHRVKQGSLAPDDAAKAIREKLEKVITPAVSEIYQNRVEGFTAAWRDVSKECYDECSKLDTFETRIVYTTPPPAKLSTETVDKGVDKLTDWRDVCAALIDIYDDAMNNAPEDRCYVDGAWKEELDKARALLAASDSQGAANEV